MTKPQNTSPLPKSSSALSDHERRGESAMQWVERYTKTLDTQYKIPGLNVPFGVDFLLGLLPGVGDAISLGLSGTLIATMARHGASPRLVLRMLINVAVDAVFGSIPVLGNLFDLFFRANSRNLRLMQEYYEEGKHRQSARPIGLAIFAAFALVMLAVLVGLVVGGYYLYQTVTNLF